MCVFFLPCRICPTRRSTGTRPASCATSVVCRWSTSSSAPSPTRSTVATAMIPNLHPDAMAAARSSVLVSHNLFKKYVSQLVRRSPKMICVPSNSCWRIRSSDTTDGRRRCPSKCVHAVFWESLMRKQSV